MHTCLKSTALFTSPIYPVHCQPYFFIIIPSLSSLPYSTCKYILSKLINLKFFLDLFYFVFMSTLLAGVTVPHAYLVLKEMMRLHVDAGYQIVVLWENKCSSLLSQFTCPDKSFYLVVPFNGNKVISSNYFA